MLAAEGVIVGAEGEGEFLRGRLQDLEPLGNDFLPHPVSRHDCDFHRSGDDSGSEAFFNLPARRLYNAGPFAGEFSEGRGMAWESRQPWRCWERTTMPAVLN